MASKRTKVVDGFTAIRAAQEAARHGHGDPLRPDAKPDETPKTTATPGAGTRIGRSVQPTKREIICPACGFSSEVTGKLQLFVCQRCRHRMKVDDHTLKPGDWSEELETGGTVTVPAETALKGGRIVANDVILHGKMEGVDIRASRRLVVGPAARVDWARVQCLDIELLAGVNLTPGKAIMGRHLILHGKFCGNAVLTGSLRVHESGDFSGQVRAAGLQVEEGGGLRASLDINPAHAPPPEPAKPAKPPGPARTAMSRPGIAKPAPTPPASDTRKGPDP